MRVNVSTFYQCSGVTPSKAYYNNTRHHFCMNSALLLLRPILHLSKNAKWNTKGAYLSLKRTIYMLVLYQNSDLMQSKVYYSNTRH